MKRFLLTATVLAGVVLPAFAAPPPPQPPSRLGMCAACHGRHGIATVPGVPNLAGQNLDYLRDALKQYRDGQRKVPVMRAAIGPLNKAELDALAQWYAAQPRDGASRP